MSNKSKYLQIFNYLKEFSKIRNKPIRNIEENKTNYPEILWLSDVPKDKLFENVIDDSFDVERFEVVEPLDLMWGIEQEDGSWNGMIAEVMNKVRVHMSISSTLCNAMVNVSGVMNYTSRL